jgi:hypothetical protein
MQQQQGIARQRKKSRYMRSKVCHNVGDGTAHK